MSLTSLLHRAADILQGEHPSPSRLAEAETACRTVIDRAKGDQAAITRADKRLKKDLTRFEKNRKECRAAMKETEF